MFPFCNLQVWAPGGALPQTSHAGAGARCVIDCAEQDSQGGQQRTSTRSRRSVCAGRQSPLTSGRLGVVAGVVNDHVPG